MAVYPGSPQLQMIGHLKINDMKSVYCSSRPYSQIEVYKTHSTNTVTSNARYLDTPSGNSVLSISTASRTAKRNDVQ